MSLVALRNNATPACIDFRVWEMCSQGEKVYTGGGTPKKQGPFLRRSVFPTVLILISLFSIDAGEMENTKNHFCADTNSTIFRKWQLIRRGFGEAAAITSFARNHLHAINVSSSGGKKGLLSRPCFIKVDVSRCTGVKVIFETTRLLFH